MTPEEQLVHLRKEEAWNLRPLINRRPVVERRHPRLFAQLGISILAGLAIGVVVVFVVSSLRGPDHRGPAVPHPVPSLPAEPSRSPTPAPTPTSTGTPIPSVRASAWTSPPQIAFNGDCGRVFSDAQIASYMGVPKARHTDAWGEGIRSWLNFAVVRHNGGLLCTWDDGAGEADPGSHPVVRMVIMSADAYPGASSYLDCLEGVSDCTFVEGAGGYLVAGSVGLNESDHSTMKRIDVAQSIVNGVVRDFPASASAAGPPPPTWSQRAGDWPAQIDCTTLFNGAGAWKQLGIKAMRFSPADDDGWPSSFEDELTVGHGYTSCSAGDSGSMVGAGILSGGSWLESEVARIKGARSVYVAGADRAIQWSVNPGEGDITSLYVFSGSNVLEFSSYKGGAADRSVAAKLLAELNHNSTQTLGSAYVTTAGYGDLKLGAPVPKDTKLVAWTTNVPTRCTLGGYWKPTATSYSASPFTVTATEDGPISRIDIRDSSITTKSGAHIGMTSAQLDSLFPTATKETSSKGSLRTVSDGLGQVVFEIGSQVANEYYPGPPADNVVLMIHVLEPGAAHFYEQDAENDGCA